jgi:hypothetical protein
MDNQSLDVNLHNRQYQKIHYKMNQGILLYTFNKQGKFLLPQ